jgi:DHA1 family tetracycline resistance protein-like MFS transporter
MNKNLYFLFFTIFLDMLGIGILIPVVPQLLGEPNSAYYLLSPSQGDLGFILLGLLMASYPLALFFASPVLGALSDKYGRKPILVFSILGTALSYFVFAYAIFTRNIILLFISRIFDGATGGNISVAQAAVADLTSHEDRTKSYGMMGAVFGLGFILGPFLGGVLSSPTILPFFNASTPFIFSGCLSILNTISIAYFFKESIKAKFKEKEIRFWASIENIAKAKKFYSVRYLFLVSFLFTCGFAFYTSFFNVYLTNKFNFSAVNVGNFFAYVGMWIIITQLFVVRNIPKKFTERDLLGPAYIASGIGIMLYLMPTVPWHLLFIVPLASIPHGIQHANYISLLTKTTEEHMRGEVLGVNASVSSLAQALPPVFAGAIAVVTAPYVPILVSALFIMSAGIVFFLKVKEPDVN